MIARAALEIEYVGLSILKPSPHNSRTHTERQIGQIAESIKRFGMVTPIGIADDHAIIYGHARALAAAKAGLAEVPVVRLSHLTEAERRAYLIADNRLALDAGWDRALLALELQELQALNFELPALGFSLPEIDQLFEDQAASQTTGTDPLDDEIPQTSANLVTRQGDIWVLGNHRLINGDARAIADYQALLGKEEVGVIFSDPPYNVPIAGNVSGLGRVKHEDFAMAVGEMTRQEFTSFLIESFRHAAAGCRDGAIAFVCMDWRHTEELSAAGREVFDELKNVCVWNKKNAGMGAFYRSKHEFVFVFKKGSAQHINTFGLGETGRHRTNVWDYAGVSALSKEGQGDLAMHPTVKPVAMIVDALKDCSQRGDIVLDNFGGSGSTLIAAEKCGRRARLIEYEPRHCDTTVRRWQKYTGKNAVLEGDGTTFDALEVGR
jgi:DNA modification methylase